MQRCIQMAIEDDIRLLVEADHRYVWHPFTQMKEWVEEEPVIITEGRDCFIKDMRGRWYLDGVSSIWVNIHGHRREELDEAIRKQLGSIAHSTLLGMGNVPSIELAERLVKLLAASLGPGAPAHVFYSDNGSTAVEAALKMAFQYWQHRGVEGRTSFLSLKNAYHGDTLGAVSVGGVDVFHGAFGPLLFKTHKAPSPYCYRCEGGEFSADCGLYCLKEMEKILKAHAGEIAAVILEPLVQAAGGMIVFPRGYLKGVKSLCKRYNVLLIADEVATGFGRTGRMFACEHEGVVPDIICLSKGITGGYLPLAATVATDGIYDAFLGGFGEARTFFHGHSYTGNPLAAACALACLDVFEKDETLKSLQPRIAMLEKWLNEVSALPHVGEARNSGFMAGVELVRDKAAREPYEYGEKKGWAVARAAMQEGVFIRPIGDVLIIMPPLVISGENLDRMLKVLGKAIEKGTG